MEQESTAINSWQSMHRQSFEIVCVLYSRELVMSVCNPEPRCTCWRSGYAPLCHVLPISGASILLLGHSTYLQDQPLSALTASDPL